MSDFKPRPGKNVDPENLKQFIEEVEFLLSRGWTQRDIGELMGISEGNFSNYLSGRFAVSNDIITEMRFLFKKVLKFRKMSSTDGTVDPDSKVSEPDYLPFERLVEEALTSLQKDVTAIKEQVFRKSDGSAQ